MQEEGNTRKVTSSHDERAPGVKFADPAGAIEADVKRQQAVDLRLAGHTFEKIGRLLGVSKKTAHEYVNDGWERINDATDEARARLRDQQEARLDKALQVILPLLEAENLIMVSEDREGNEVRSDAAELKLKAIDRLVKVVSVQNLLRGLNAPQKLEVTKDKSAIEPLAKLRARVVQSDKHRQQAATPGWTPRVVQQA